MQQEDCESDQDAIRSYRTREPLVHTITDLVHAGCGGLRIRFLRLVLKFGQHKRAIEDH